MLRNRWSISLIGALLLAMLAVTGAAMRQTASASPATQADTPTGTVAATGTVTTTATITTTTTATETTTPSETPTTTETAAPSATITPTTTMTPTATIVPTTTATPGPVVMGRFWSYAAKFVCGSQPAGSTSPGAPALAPGSYATTIDIHNPNYVGSLAVYRKIVLLVDQGSAIGRAPATAQPAALGPALQLSDDGATMEDCASIWAMANPGVTLPSPMPLMAGYLVVVSPMELDVVSGTTATPSATQGASGIAIDSTPVDGKQVLIPSTAFPGGVLPRHAELAQGQPQR